MFNRSSSRRGAKNKSKLLCLFPLVHVIVGLLKTLRNCKCMFKELTFSSRLTKFLPKDTLTTIHPNYDNRHFPRHSPLGDIRLISAHFRGPARFREALE
jgi:hypothetical protein